MRAAAALLGESGDKAVERAKTPGGDRAGGTDIYIDKKTGEVIISRDGKHGESTGIYKDELNFQAAGGSASSPPSASLYRAFAANSDNETAVILQQTARNVPVVGVAACIIVAGVVNFLF